MKFVSLGSRCEINLLFDQYKLRDKNLPFDWAICDDCSTVAELINTNFQDCFKEEDQYWVDAFKTVGDLKTNFERPHFYTSMFDWERDKNKIVRYMSLCIERFNDLQKENCIIFFRQTRTNNLNIIKIYESLRNKFKNNWHLLLLTDPAEFPLVKEDYENFHEVRFYKKKFEEIGEFVSTSYDRDAKKLFELLINKKFKDLKDFHPCHNYGNNYDKDERWKI